MQPNIKENPALGGAGSDTENGAELFSKSIVHQTGGNSAGNLRRACFHLGDQDRQAIKRICEKLDLPTSALAIRYALRLLDKHLTNNPPRGMVEAALLVGGVEAEDAQKAQL